MPTLNALATHRALHLREDFFMHPHIAIAFQIAKDHQAREREASARDRAHAHARRPLRHQLGHGLIRLGRRLAPEPSHEPAWSR